jgi:hypothetical protein
MSETVIVAMISLFGTLAGTFGGIMTSSRLTGYRIEQLEAQMKKYNNLIERTFKLEESATLQEEKIKVANHRIDDLERKVEK